LAQYGTWIPYAGVGKFGLAAMLALIASSLAYAGAGLPRPIPVTRPGRAVSALLVTMWMLALMVFGVSVITYLQALAQRYGAFTPPASPIFPITFLSGIVAFFSIAFLARAHGFWILLWSGLVGALAGTMMFELPFDLIVMFRLYPPVAVHFTLLFFLPLFLLGISTFSLLTVSPALRGVSKFTFLPLAAMLGVFAL
jgi:hypothetical protein